MGHWQHAELRRIILANQPRLLRKMLQRAIDHAPGLRVVGEISEPGGLAALLDQTGADWVIISLKPNGKTPDAVDRLLADYPSLRILAVAADGSQAKLVWTASYVEPLGELSLDRLLTLLSRGWPDEARLVC
jgi:DNA-binding NarL/FixJ family response regulator